VATRQGSPISEGRRERARLTKFLVGIFLLPNRSDDGQNLFRNPTSRKTRNQTYTQFTRQMRLQLAGMGTMALSQFGAAFGPEQSNASPRDGDTHDGLGIGGKQPPEASEYSVPSGQTPASVSANWMHPYAG
jgi:hypothetical protein